MKIKFLAKMAVQGIGSLLFCVGACWWLYFLYTNEAWSLSGPREGYFIVMAVAMLYSGGLFWRVFVSKDPNSMTPWQMVLFLLLFGGGFLVYSFYPFSHYFLYSDKIMFGFIGTGAVVSCAPVTVILFVMGIQDHYEALERKKYKRN